MDKIEPNEFDDVNSSQSVSGYPDSNGERNVWVQSDTQEDGYSVNERYAKIDDPLSEPQVREGLKQMKITSTQLISMGVKELNKRLSSCPPLVVAKLKRCRRTLKNRGYAKNCRIKRIAAKNRLEQINSKLVTENQELQHRNRLLIEQLDKIKANPYLTATETNNVQQAPPTQACNQEPIGYDGHRQDFTCSHFYPPYTDIADETYNQYEQS